MLKFHSYQDTPGPQVSWGHSRLNRVTCSHIPASRLKNHRLTSEKPKMLMILMLKHPCLLIRSWLNHVRSIVLLGKQKGMCSPDMEPTIYTLTAHFETPLNQHLPHMLEFSCRWSAYFPASNHHLMSVQSRFTSSYLKMCLVNRISHHGLWWNPIYRVVSSPN